MAKHADDGVSVSVCSVEGTWTPAHSKTWGNDVVENKNKSWNWTRTRGFRTRWISKYWAMIQAVKPVIRSAQQTVQSASIATWSFIAQSLSPFLVQVLTAKKQWFAFFMFLCCAVVPMVMLGYYTPRPGFAFGSLPPYYNVFAAKYMRCDNFIDNNPANSTVMGIEGLFVLDMTWGRFSFSAVKTIDVAWDILVGRGVQLLGWWTAYIVFSDALLRVIERHPASFRVFQRIALEGPSLLSLWTLCKELLSVRSKRTKALFAYILLSTSYVLCIPMFLGAMTGYDSTSIAWMDLDDSNNIVPTSEVKYAWAIFGTANSTFDQPFCANTSYNSIQLNYAVPRLRSCTCQMPNGTLAPPNTFRYTGELVYHEYQDWSSTEGLRCIFNYKGSNGTFEDALYNEQTGSYNSKTIYNCNETVTYKVNDQFYDIQDLNVTSSLCYNHKTYSIMDLQGRSRCLPDTANPSYQWGFSTMLSGIFVFIHFGWCVSMYIVWLDAQSKSTLIQEGYEMTQLRAAFVIAKVVKRKTGMGEKQLVRHDTKDLNKEIHGTGKDEGTKIDYNVFVASAEEDEEDKKGIRRRRALALDGIPP